jgi:hypothetical protein
MQGLILSKGTKEGEARHWAFDMPSARRTSAQAISLLAD